jgi:hypothetical protein
MLIQVFMELFEWKKENIKWKMQTYTSFEWKNIKQRMQIEVWGAQGLCRNVFHVKLVGLWP